MKRELTYSNRAIKGLNKVPKKQATKMRESLNMIAADEVAGLDIKKEKKLWDRKLLNRMENPLLSC